MVSEVLLPIAWFENELSMNDETLAKLSRISLLSTLIILIPIELVIIGIFCIIISLSLAGSLYIKVIVKFKYLLNSIMFYIRKL
jgi:hypothetical protein